MCQRPWMGLTQAQIIMAVSSGRQLQLAQGCPTSLRKFIAKCMAFKAADRPTFTQVRRVHTRGLLCARVPQAPGGAAGRRRRDALGVEEAAPAVCLLRASPRGRLDVGARARALSRGLRR